MKTTKKAPNVNSGPTQSLNNANYNPMHCKNNVFQQTAQDLLTGNHEITAQNAFFGTPANKTVSFIENGRVRNFSELSPTVFTLLANAYTTNAEARWAFEGLLDSTGKIISFSRRVELYTYYTCRNLNLEKPALPIARRIANFFAA